MDRRGARKGRTSGSRMISGGSYVGAGWLHDRTAARNEPGSGSLSRGGRRGDGLASHGNPSITAKTKVEGCGRIHRMRQTSSVVGASRSSLVSKVDYHRDVPGGAAANCSAGSSGSSSDISPAIFSGVDARDGDQAEPYEVRGINASRFCGRVVVGLLHYDSRWRSRPKPQKGPKSLHHATRDRSKIRREPPKKHKNHA